MKPTKQQAICLKLAQWLGLQSIEIRGYGSGKKDIYYSRGDKLIVFDPFTSTIDGRAQFAECVIKALSAGLLYVSRQSDQAVGYWYNSRVFWIYCDNTAPKSIAAATLEAIFYAIGGTADWEEKPKSRNHEDGDYSYLCGRDYCRCTQ